MKKCFVLTTLLCSVLIITKSFGQNTSQIPPFKLLRTTGRFFTAQELPQNKPVMLIYFAPDCGHCLDLLSPLFKQSNKFNGVTVVLATFKPVNELALFERTYKIASYPNVILGTEGTTFFLRNHYSIQKTPFVALYDGKGRLVQTFNNEPSVEDLVTGLKKL